MSLNESLNQQVSGLVTQNPIVFFMKETRYTPQCGFSVDL
jgi:glutaredoxin-related protein